VIFIFLYQGKNKRNRQFENKSQMAENYLLGMDSALKNKVESAQKLEALKI